MTLETSGGAPIGVLVVDDSAFMRRAITKMLEGELDIVVCGTARSGEDAIEKAERLRPDLITMDVQMQGIGGLEAVRQIVERRFVPIIMVSALTREGAETTLHALDLGAVDFIPKPDAAYVNIKDVARDLIAKVRVFARRGSPARALPGAPPPSGRRLRRTGFDCVAIGTSTGGPVALGRVLARMPATFPLPIVVVQHMPSGFTRPFAERLNAQSRLEISEARSGMQLRPGLAIIASAGKQLRLFRSRAGVEVSLEDDAAGSVHVPSFDVMASEVAGVYGGASVGVVMTGMGQDGLVGLRAIHDRGGFVVGQDAASCVVYGMPRAAADAGLVDAVVPLEEISGFLCELTRSVLPNE